MTRFLRPSLLLLFLGAALGCSAASDSTDSGWQSSGGGSAGSAGAAGDSGGSAGSAADGGSGGDGGAGGATAGNGGNGGVGGAAAGSGGVGGAAAGSGGDAGAGGGAGSGGSAGGGCPSGVICVPSLPYIDSNSTSGANAQLNGYSCASDVNEGGAERVYRVDVGSAGLLVASLDGLPDGVDVDVHILRQLDPTTCIDRGNWDAAVLLDPGRYWVVVDSWVDGSGQSMEGKYELSLALNTAADHTAQGLAESVLRAGLLAFDRAWVHGDTTELEYGIIDYTMPSIKPRFFVLDLRRSQMLFSELVAHGSGSQDPNDITMTGSMSNTSGSHASSVGLVLTAETYQGSHGYSLRLDGLEPGFNDNDRSRAILVHAADYATQDFVNANGYLGRSWGCAAVDPAISHPLIDTLRNGRLLLKYFDDPNWLNGSSYVAP